MTADGSRDEEIKPHHGIAGDIEDKFKEFLESGCRSPTERQLSVPFIIEVSVSEDEVEDEAGLEWDPAADSEDEDDEPGEDSGSDDDGKREPIPGAIELDFVEDEQAEIRAARNAIDKEDEVQVRDFALAARIARQSGYAVGPEYSGQSREREFNRKRKEIYDRLLSEHEEQKGRKATAKQIETLWNKAAADATEESEAALPSGGARRSARNKRNRNLTNFFLVNKFYT